MKNKYASMNNQYLNKKIRCLGNVQISKKRRGVLGSEEKRIDKAIKERIRNSLKVSDIWKNHKIRRYILNYYYYVNIGN